MSKIMINRACLKAIEPFMSNEEARYYLKGVFFQNGLIIATEGRLLAAIKPAVVNGRLEDMILPRDTVEKILKVKPQFKKDAVWVNIELGEGTGVAVVWQAMNKEEHILAQSFVPVDGTFPDWRRVVPGAENFDLLAPEKGRTEQLPASFNPALLAAFQSFGDCITLYPNREPAAPMLVRAKTDDFDAVGVIMPRRDDLPLDVLPEWLSIKSLFDTSEEI